LPERHPVRDFFVLDTLDLVPKSDMATMEHPIYSLSTKPERRQLTYSHGDCRIEIIPSSLGLPTVFDKDVLIYCISKLMRMKNAGEAIGPTVRLTTHDMLVETNRPTNNLGYERLLPALNRLRGVVINTTIATGGVQSTRGFGLIDAFEYNRKGSMFSERLRYLEVKLSDWIFRAIASAEVLPISRHYFRLRAPVDRRIYEIARKHCGRQAAWRIGFDLLQKKVGSKQATKHFLAHVRNLMRSNHLPDYAVTVEGDKAVFYKRDDVKPWREKEGGVIETADVARPKTIRISQQAFDQIAELAPRWDKHMLEGMYVEWARNKDAARNEDARFIGWLKSYTKGKAAP